MTASLYEVLKNHLTNRIGLSVQHVYQHGIRNGPCVNRAESGEMCPDACICHLSHVILLEIFANLDLQNQMRTKRVCSLWQALLSAPWTNNQHITIRYGGCACRQVFNDTCYTVAILLNRSVNAATKSLALTGCGTANHLHVVEHWLSLTKLQLQWVVLSGARFACSARPYHECAWRKHSGFKQEQCWLKHGIMHRLRPFKGHCHTLIVHNWTVARLFYDALWAIFYTFGEHYNSTPFPASERRRMLSNATDFPDGIWQVALRRVVLPCDSADGWHGLISRLMCALDAALPPVDDQVYDTVSAVHGRWLHSLAYPEEWQTIRHLLSVFSGFQADGSPLRWDETDLRQLDVRQLSRMALLAISQVFAAR
ncbi:uncharacterized protein LOC129587267 [Paramacrobiotus metropolitanus]|uniref:uncharacterized protein LOC129587267 n=1 Tax=Paramacrobiotus metropolitanus TaxID=2943436 RepID=UPI002445FE48|nr:uncharacterized protein LOC129587267 [Paramacrobiotus metropolitanus]XP_055336884.1 uncharacterized protein LOC129587267 [Paramacrobiotus metropolitanus]XP_055336885.1 uncharacterized protein LOC129587267 [Paramacrobiotus metropolitanus]XP_055336886.1 uncharacterized protein LOC129587267 [Paramacrobiotus metropolitanus]XP_055336888.1 uncharacterized protein LOC129587267 [Paramacrobiotus metropolitanus]XP_055336889.1 uncharacterized protein LOC129587267 [Paramacrobiotus metropolitanus]XP_05